LDQCNCISKLTGWDAPARDRWLTNPSALLPGTRIFFQISDPQSRADVIAFLEEHK
jgi:cytochrome c